jgi:hypothetical protein
MRANAYPARLHRTSCARTAAPETIRLFRNQDHPDERQNHDDRQGHQDQVPSLRHAAPPAAPAHPPLGLLDPGTMQRDVNVGHGRHGLLAGHSATLFLRP